jgi:coenzyme F420-reducing hydrogenase delta subunit
MRLEYPLSLKIVELPCTGRVDARHILRAFEDGADGVMVAG